MRVVVVLVLVLVAVVATVHAQPATERARVSQALQTVAALEQQLEYEQALVLADRTIASGISTRDQLADLHLIAGRLAAGLDHPEVAQQHFAKLLALRPDTALVAGTSPKLTAPFEAARAAPHALAVTARIEADRVVVEVASDPLHLVAGLRVECSGAGPVHGGHLEHALVATIPAGVIAIQAIVTDDAGNELATLALAAPLPPMAGTARVQRSAAWIPWAAASGATLLAGGLCAWRFGIARDEWNRLNDGTHDYSQLHAIETRGQRWAIAADLGFGLAAAAAVTAAIVLATGRESEPRGGLAFTGTGAAYLARF
ncbi:MAG: hypothetical protein ABI467_12670 [Kofleriaceae bacterium]